MVISTGIGFPFWDAGETRKQLTSPCFHEKKTCAKDIDGFGEKPGSLFISFLDS